MNEAERLQKRLDQIQAELKAYQQNFKDCNEYQKKCQAQNHAWAVYHEKQKEKQKEPEIELPQKANVSPYLYESRYLEGVEGIIELYRKSDKKRLYFFSDLHNDLGGCTTEFKTPNPAGSPPKSKISIPDFLDKVIKDNPKQAIDVFVEWEYVSKQYPDTERLADTSLLTIQNTGYLFGQLVPYLESKGCLQMNKDKCNASYPNARFHYIDFRTSSKILRYLTLFAPATGDILEEYKKTKMVDIRAITGVYQAIQRVFPNTQQLTVTSLLQDPRLLKQYGSASLLSQVIQKLLRSIHPREFIPTKTRQGHKEQIHGYTFVSDDFEYLNHLPLQEIYDSLVELKRLSLDSNFVEEIDALVRTIVALKEELVAKLSCIMDVYAIGRYTKPYVRNGMVFMGALHVRTQLQALKLLGFEIVDSNPRGYENWIALVSVKRDNQSDRYVRIPNDAVKYQIFHDETQNTYSIIYEDANGKQWRDSLNVISNQQCVPLASVSYPLFYK
jgi:hypothetical protein